MRYTSYIFILLLALLLQNTTAYAACNTFYSNSSFNVSLADRGASNEFTFVNISGNIHYISFGATGNLDVEYWNGSGWADNATLETWNGNQVAANSIDAFVREGELYLLAYASTASVRGYRHNGTHWLDNSSINKSLPDFVSVGHSSYVNTGSNEYYFIENGDDQHITAYEWVANDWVVNTTMNASLPTGDTTFRLDMFFLSGSLYALINKTSTPGLLGYMFNGTEWIADSTYNNTVSTPAAFDDIQVLNYSGNTHLWYSTAGQAHSYSYYPSPISLSSAALTTNVTWLAQGLDVSLGAVITPSCGLVSVWLQTNESGAYANATASKSVAVASDVITAQTFNLTFSNSTNCNTAIGWRICGNVSDGSFACSSSASFYSMPYVFSSGNASISATGASCTNSTYLTFNQDILGMTNFTVYMPKQTAYGNVTCPYYMRGQYRLNITNTSDYCTIWGRGRSLSTSYNIIVSIDSGISGSLPSNIPVAIAATITGAVVVITTYYRRRRRSSYSSSETQPRD